MFLVDVFETLVHCDFSAHDEELPALAGVVPAAWREVSRRLMPQVASGELSLFDAFTHVLRECGHAVDQELVAELVARDQALLLQQAELFDDALPFLHRLRECQARVAIVSNCAENTRPLLQHLGIPPLVDAVVLSCEVGAAKPDAAIYIAALTELGASPAEAVLVDDQQAYCDGARAAGMAAVQLVRNGTSPRSARSLLDVDV